MKPGLGWRQEAGAGGPATPPPEPRVSPVSGFTGSGRRERLHTERLLLIGDINKYLRSHLFKLRRDVSTYLFFIPGGTRPLASVLLVRRDEAVLRPLRPLTSALLSGTMLMASTVLRPLQATDLCRAKGGRRLLTSTVLRAVRGY